MFSFSWKVHVYQVKKKRNTTETGSKAREALAEIDLPGMGRMYMEERMKGDNIKKPKAVWLLVTVEV